MALEFTQDLLGKLATYPLRVRREVMKELGKVEFDRCAQDPLYWLDSSQHPIPYVYTQEHHIFYKCQHCPPGRGVVPFNKRLPHLKLYHPEIGEELEGGEEEDRRRRVGGHFKAMESVRPFTVKPYMKPLVEVWLDEPMVLVEKSRDMMATWLYLALYSWDTQFHRGRQNFVQSENAAKTYDLIRRCHFLLKNQPGFLRDVHPATFVKGEKNSGSLKVESLDSELSGLPQGADQIRQYHPTGVFTDETAFHGDAGEVFAAVQPSIRNGGRYTGVSSASPGWFYLAAQDALDLES